MSFVSNSNLKSILESFKDKFTKNFSEIDNKLDNVNYIQKVARTGESGYLQARGSITSRANLNGGESYFKNLDIVNGNTDLISLDNRTGYLSLKRGFTYHISVDPQCVTNVPFTLVDSTVSINNSNVNSKIRDDGIYAFSNSGGESMNEWNGNGINAIIKADTDKTIKLIPLANCVVTYWCCTLLVEVIATVAIDPVEYTDSNFGIQDTPIGTKFSMLSTESYPNTYLPTDGREVNIGDYPDFEHYLIDTFGFVNYYGGDGVTTYKVPNDIDQELYTDNIGNTDWVASSNSVYNDQYPASQAFTDNDGYWCSTQNPGFTAYIQIDFAREKKLNCISLNFSAYNAGFSQFTVYGSKDGETWNVIGTYGITNYVKLDKTYSYRFYRLGNFARNVDYIAITRIVFGWIKPKFIIKTKKTHALNVQTSLENNYSRDEQRVGYWIDGKPLYQKTLLLTIPPGETFVDLDLPKTNFVTLKDGFLISANNWCYPITFFANGTYSFINFNTDGSQAYILATDTTLYNSQAYITVQYTKVID